MLPMQTESKANNYRVVTLTPYGDYFRMDSSNSRGRDGMAPGGAAKELLGKNA
jgi:hypothetical protein